MTVSDQRSFLHDKLNSGDFCAPVLSNNLELAVGDFSGQLVAGSRGWRSLTKGLGVGLGTLGGGLLGLVIGGPVGVGIGCAAFGAGFGTAAAVLNQGNSPVADLAFYDSISIDGQGDVTSDILNLAMSNVVETMILDWLPGQSISFVDPTVFSPTLKTDTGAVVTDILGLDTILLNRDGQSAFGVAIYNDPDITGRVLTQTDVVDLDLTAITSEPVGTTINYTGTLLIALDNPQDLVQCIPTPSSLVLFLIGPILLLRSTAMQKRRVRLRRA